MPLEYFMMGDEKEKFVALKLLQVLVKNFERECVCVWDVGRGERPKAI